MLSLTHHSDVTVVTLTPLYVMLRQFFNDITQTEILSTETSDFLKQILFSSHLIYCLSWPRLCFPRQQSFSRLWATLYRKNVFLWRLLKCWPPFKCRYGKLKIEKLLALKIYSITLIHSLYQRLLFLVAIPPDTQIFSTKHPVRARSTLDIMVQVK